MEVDIILILLFIIASLLIGVLLKFILKRTFLPYTVGLFIAGLAIGFITRYHILHIPESLDSLLKSVSDMDPEIILYLFLPILIFEASINMDIHIFKKSLLNASVLAVPGVIVCLILTGILIMGLKFAFPLTISQWSWESALMFGALISATDPVAVVALLNELKTSKRFSTLVDAESLLNDGTGIVFFMLFFGTFTVAGLQHGPIANFFITVIGAIVVGYILALVSLWIAKKAVGDPIIQNSILFISSYILFYFTNRILEVSGVIALVTFGVVIAYYGPTTLRPKANEFIKQFWELATYLANTLIFLLVGLLIAMKCDFVWKEVGILLIVYVGIMVIRGIMIFMFYPILHRKQYGITPKEGIVLCWGGLRGALALTLALLVFYTPSVPEEARKQILFFTGGIVTLTLIINATSMKWLLSVLKLTKKPSSKILLDYDIKSIYRHKSLEFLEKLKSRKSLEGANWNDIEGYLPQIGPQPEVVEIPEESMLASIRRKIMGQNLSKCMELFQEGIISVDTYKKLTGMVEEIDDYEGELPFTKMIDYFNTFSSGSPIKVKTMEMNNRITRLLRAKNVQKFDFLYGFNIIEEDALLMIDKIKKSPEVKINVKDDFATVKKEILENIEAAKEQNQLMTNKFPIACNMYVNLKAQRILLRKERGILRDMAASGVITDEEEAILIENVGNKADLTQKQ